MTTYITMLVASLNQSQNHCVVIVFWFSGIKECMLFTFEFRSYMYARGRVVWHLSLLLMISFNQPVAAISSMQDMLC